MHLLDASSATYPVFTNTWPFAVARLAFVKVTGKGPGASTSAAHETSDDEDSSVSGSDAPGSGASTPNRENGNGKAVRVPTVMAGGKRRKATKKR